MKAFFAVLAILLVLFAAIGWTQGWISFRQSEDKATIEIETEDMKDAADDAAKKAKDGGAKLLEKTNDALQRGEEELDDSVDPATTLPDEDSTSDER